MKVLVACEFSGIVRDAFIKRGHDAISCDLLPTERPGPHIQGDVLNLLGVRHPPSRLPSRLPSKFDLMIAFPPCTHLAVSGAAWFKNKKIEQAKAIDFFIALAWANIPKIAIENPIGIMSTYYRKPDQIIQPWQFGHGETKATCLWLKNLPKLIFTKIVSLPIKKSDRMKMHYLPPSEDRWMKRSRTYLGIADAMVDQWGSLK